MVLPGGDVKLMDFGIAKVDTADLTAPGDFLGTPSYMSPEQASGTPLDGRSDIFSLGAVLYFMLTGRRPFDAPTVPGVMARVVSSTPDPLDVRELPADGEYVVGRCLEKLARARYARAREVEEDIEDVLAGRPPRHRPRPTSEPATKPGIGDAVIRGVGRLRSRALAATLAVLALIGLASATLRRPPPSPSVAALPSADPSPSPSPLPARLEVSVRHPFRLATVRVWVDGVLQIEERVPGRVTRNLLAVKLRRGTFRAAVDVEAGDRTILVQVDDGNGFRESRRIRATLAPGEPRVLEAVVEGVVSKDMKLAWER
jgi:serine/threonine-protein kinase